MMSAFSANVAPRSNPAESCAVRITGWCDPLRRTKACLPKYFVQKSSCPRGCRICDFPLLGRHGTLVRIRINGETFGPPDARTTAVRAQSKCPVSTPRDCQRPFLFFRLGSDSRVQPESQPRFLGLACSVSSLLRYHLPFCAPFLRAR